LGIDDDGEHILCDHSDYQKIVYLNGVYRTQQHLKLVMILAVTLKEKMVK
jgi:hypothetical protein